MVAIASLTGEGDSHSLEWYYGLDAPCNSTEDKNNNGASSNPETSGTADAVDVLESREGSLATEQFNEKGPN